MSDPLLYSQDGAAAVISVNDAPHNRMSLDFVDQLETKVAEIAEDDSVRAVVITAEGLENFSVGMNLMQLFDGLKAAGGLDAFMEKRKPVFNQ